jgi:hypothetical protein
VAQTAMSSVTSCSSDLGGRVFSDRVSYELGDGSRRESLPRFMWVRDANPAALGIASLCCSVTSFAYKIRHCTNMRAWRGSSRCSSLRSTRARW